MTSTFHHRAAYGDRMAGYFRLVEAPSLVISAPTKPILAVTRLTMKDGQPQQTCSIPEENAFVVALHLSPACRQGCEVWKRDDYSRIVDWPVGGVGIYDLEQNPRWRNPSPIDWIQYYIPRSTLDAFSDDLEIANIENLACEYGKFDDVLYQLTQLIVPSLNEEQMFCDLFLDHFRLLLCSHITQRYAPSLGPVKIYQGGLAPWQKRRVVEMLKENLDGQIGLSALAQECGLSVSHFTRSFRRSFGTSAHRYLILQRIEQAKSLLSNTAFALADVALQAGFSDQTSFTRAFKVIVGLPPGHWRRKAKVEGGSGCSSFSVECRDFVSNGHYQDAELSVA